jgi:hypothetical protein
MSTSLIVLIPFILLGIVGMLCFVGCILPTYGLGPSFTTYTGTTVLLNPAIIAYWPLKEIADTIPASELISGNTGNYIDQNSAPALYPWPAYNIPDGSGTVLSAAAPGTIALAQPGIVVGDVVPPESDPVPPACMVVNGCYVEVPFNVKFIPQASFTVEAWVRVDWTALDPNAFRFVLDVREFSPATTGIGLCAKPVDDQPGVYQWRGIVGDGSDAFVFADSSEAPFTLKDPTAAAGTIHYLALTYDSPSQTLALFVNGAQHGQATNAGYAANTTQPLWIGAGAPYVPRRPQASGIVGSPLFPFVGAIQDVAIYSAALTADVILLHYHNGQGTDP